MRQSQTKILSKWVGVGLPREAERLVLEMLWALGKVQISTGAFESAREAFALLARADARLSRQLTARIVNVPGGCELLQSLGLWSRRLRGLPTTERA